MELDFNTLANPPIRNLTPYQPGKPIEEVERELGLTDVIKLASNENPLGVSPKALHAAQQALLKTCLYPDGGCYDIKNALARFLNVTANQLTIGNGSENILEIIVKSYLSPGTSAIISQYAFLTIQLLIKASGATMITVPAKNWRQDIDATIASITENTRMIFVVNPNNPTGTYTTKNEMNHLLNSISPNILVIIDEAYHEYIERDDYPNSLELLKQYPNLIISRTFSKAYGMAALRLGYCISSPAIADILNRARLPFNVNTIAAAAGCEALKDQDHVMKTQALNHAGMEQVEAGLKKLGIDYIPSLGNFITFDVKRNANEIYQSMLYEGVIVRPLGAYGMPTHLRVTISTSEQNTRFLNTLKKVLQ